MIDSTSATAEALMAVPRRSTKRCLLAYASLAVLTAWTRIRARFELVGSSLEQLAVNTATSATASARKLPRGAAVAGFFARLLTLALARLSHHGLDRVVRRGMGPVVQAVEAFHV